MSTPAEGSVSPTPPSVFTFAFSEAVRFHQAILKKDSDKDRPLRDAPNTEAKTLTILAPSLTAGHYANWSGFTQESEVLSDRIGFTVSAAPAG
jgi:methionine-rich copper-binding protein CopC